MQDRDQKQFSWKVATALLAAAVALMAVLAGCSTPSTGQGNEGAPVDAPAASEQQSSYPLTLTLHDGDGNEFQQIFNQAPQRVITLTDSTAEIMCRLGLADKVVGTVEPEAPMPADIAEEYAKIPVLGDKKTLSREVIVGSSPDVVMGRAMTFTAEKQSDPATYNGLGSNVYIQTATAEKGDPTLKGVIQDVKNIAAIFNVQDKAQPLIDDLESRLASMEQQVSQQKTDGEKSVLIMTNFKNGTFGTFGGATGATLQFNVIKMLGAKMASVESASGLTYENLIELAPDVIVYVTAERNKSTDGAVLDTLYNEPALQSVPAVADKRVVTLPYAEFMDTTPRLFDSAEKILKTLYPKA